jgi:hypothetical protein
MKNILSIILVFTTIIIAKAQDIQASLNSAQTAYAANNAQEARLNLQQALIDLNEIIGRKILGLMPPTLGGLEVNQDEDAVIGGTGFAGLMVSRSWGTDANKNIDVTLANDSPMLTMVNSFLGNEMLSGIMASQTGQKRVTVSGYKGMLEKSEAEDGNVSYTINVPVDDTLFTFATDGFASETEVMAMAQQINLNKIMALLK